MEENNIVYCTGCKEWKTDSSFELRQTYAQTMESPAEYEYFCNDCDTHIDSSYEFETWELVESLNKANIRYSNKGIVIK